MNRTVFTLRPTKSVVALSDLQSDCVLSAGELYLLLVANWNLSVSHLYLACMSKFNIIIRAALITSPTCLAFCGGKPDTARICCWPQCCCAAAAPLLLGARHLPLLIDISCPRGAQQQTSRMLLQWSIDDRDRLTDTWPLRRSCSAYFASSVSNMVL